MKKEIKKIIRITIGIILIIVGVFGLFLPLLQGIALIIAGLYLLHYKPLTKFVKKQIKKFKKWENKNYFPSTSSAIRSNLYS